jgi:G3E family GTPase
VLIETSGLADPVPILGALKTHRPVVSRYRVAGVVATIDMASGAASLAGHVEAVRQAAMADRLLLTKADLATTEQRSALLARLDRINPDAPRSEVEHGVIAATGLLEPGRTAVYAGSAPWAGGFTFEALSPGTDPWPDVSAHDESTQASCVVIDEPLPKALWTPWLEQLVARLGPGLLRIKGIVDIEGHDQPIIVQGVPQRLHPPSTLPCWPGDDRRSRLVVITRNVDPALVEGAFDALRRGARRRDPD